MTDDKLLFLRRVVLAQVKEHKLLVEGLRSAGWQDVRPWEDNVTRLREKLRLLQKEVIDRGLD